MWTYSHIFAALMRAKKTCQKKTLRTFCRNIGDEVKIISIKSTHSLKIKKEMFLEIINLFYALCVHFPVLWLFDLTDL